MKLKIAGLCALLFIGSCSTLHEFGSDDPLAGETLLFLALKMPPEFRTGKPGQICTVTLNTFSFPPKKILVRVPLDNEMIITSMDPSNYKVTHVRCGAYQTMTKSSFNPSNPTLSLASGAVNYMGVISVEKAPQGGNYDFFIKANEAQEFLRRHYARLRIDQKERLKSAYTGQPITQGMIFHATKKSLSANTDSGERTIVADKARVTNLVRSCTQPEQIANPVRMGQYKLRASYDEGKLLKVERLDDRNTYSQVLVDCIEAGLQKYRPSSGGYLTFQLEL
jgi:hypothetical protein